MKILQRQFILVIFLALSQHSFSQSFPDLHFGTDETLDIITWNIEWFPKEGQTTITNVKNIIKALDAEIIAIQEIDVKSSFQQLIDELEDYDGYYLNDEYQSLGYLYKKSNIQIIDQYEIYTSQTYWSPFPRSPLVLEIKHQNKNYIIINNHLKCCGDGSLDPYDNGDEESRRLLACNLLDEYIRDHFDDQRVILVGDLNDELTDRMLDNVFTPFINNSNEYRFADMEIAESSSSDWSYPNWPSHLDHILITNELFESYGQEISNTEVIKLEEHFYGGFNEYDQKVSDHRPVGLQLKTEALGIFESETPIGKLICSPNPTGQQTIFNYTAVQAPAYILLYNSKGQVIDQMHLPLHSTSTYWSRSHQKAGVYYTQLIENGQIISSGKCVLLD